MYGRKRYKEVFIFLTEGPGIAVQNTPFCQVVTQKINTRLAASAPEIVDGYSFLSKEFKYYMMILH